VLLGQHRHAEHQRVHAGQHLPAGTEHPRDLGHDVLGRQPQRERAVLGDHAVGAAVGQELEAGRVRRHRGEAVFTVGRQGGGVDYAQDVVAGVGGQVGRARARAGYVDQEP